jgi:uncharacterized phage protein gp47/JayE
MKQSIIGSFPTLLPEITDTTDANPFVRIVTVVCGVAEQLNLMLDFMLYEAMSSKARIYKHVEIHADNKDYRIRGYVGATGYVVFQLDATHSSNIIIPKGTILQTEDGIVYVTIVACTILQNTISISVEVEQIEDGEELTFTYDPNLDIFLGSDVRDGYVTIEVDGDSFTFVDTFAYSNPTDKHFTTKVQENGELKLVFGDNINGVSVSSGATIVANVKLTQGADGMATPYSINIIVSSLTLPTGRSLVVFNSEATTGGMEPESSFSVRRKATYYASTRDTAVTSLDYSQLAELVPGVIRAKEYYDCNKVVPIYITTTGGEPSNLLLKRV